MFRYDGKTLAELRVHAGMTVDQLAKKSGVEVFTIRNVENGISVSPSNPVVVALLHALGYKVVKPYEFDAPAVPVDRCGPKSTCILLGFWIQERGDRGPGFRKVFSVVTKKDPNRSFLGVTYRRRWSDRPMLLNFCPFCGKTPGIGVGDDDE